MAETLTLEQPTSPEAQGLPLTPDELERLNALETQLTEGSFTTEEKQEFDALTSPDHMALDAETRAPEEPPVEPDKPYQFDENSLQVQIADVSGGVTANARDHAEAHINKVTTEVEGRNKFTRFAKGFAAKVWKGNYARDYISLRQQQIGREKIIESGNLYAMQNGSKSEHDRAMGAVIQRVSNTEFLSQKETQKNLAEIEHGQDLETELRSLIKKYAEGNVNDDALNEGKSQLLAKFGKKSKDRNKGLLFADNVTEVARNARAAFLNDVGIDRIDAALKARHTEAQVGVRSELKVQGAERFANWLYKNKLGTVLNEATIVAGASIAVAASKVAFKKALTAASFGVGYGVVGGGIAAVRERLHVGRDRTTHMREMAEGGGNNLASAGKRREAIDATRYRSFAATELTAELATVRESTDLNEMLDVVTRTSTLMNESDRRNADFIQYNSKTTVEQGRLDLLLSLAEARKAVQDALNSASEDTLRAAQIDPANRSVKTLIEARANAVDGVLAEINGDVDARDAAFRKTRRRRALMAAGTTIVVGETVGLGMQELEATIRDDLQGVFASHRPGETRQTVLAGLFRKGGSGAHEVVGANGHDTSLVAIDDHSAVNVPKGYHLQHDGGKWELFDSHHNVIDNNVTFEDGHFSNETQHLLSEKGFNFHETNTAVTDPNTVTYPAEHLTPQEFVNAHKSDFTHVQRDLWYDNNTPNTYDDNELNLWWGGHNGTGINTHGDYEFNVGHMSPDGSFHGVESTNAQHLIHEGRMKIALSITEGTQSHVVLVSVNEHGNAIIPHDSQVADLLFAKHDGHAQYNGAFAEAVRLGAVHNGVQHMNMLATVVGANHPNTHGLIDHSPRIQHHMHEQVITTMTAPAAVENSGPSLVEVAPFIPIRARGGLESAKRNSSRSYSNYGYGYEGDEEDWEGAINAMVVERSPRLSRNPEATLNPYEELDWYKNELIARRGPEEVARLEAAIEQSPELREMSKDVESIVTLPVAAIQEADTLYDTLSLYGKQSEESLKKSVILLNFNWIDAAASKNNSQQSIEKARQAIERARQDFPDLKVAVVENEYNLQKVESTGGVIGYVAADLVDVALLAIQKRMQSGDMEPNHEVLLIRNDADPEGMSKSYLENYQKAFSDPKNKDIDVLKGVTRFGVRWAEKYPGFSVASNFAAALSIQLSGRGLPATGGANFGIKASTLAAVGGLGVMTRTGAGSDDGALGRRIRLARWGVGIFPRGSLNQSSVLPNGQTVPYRTIAAHVMGASVDTNPARLIPYYLEGESYANAWGPDFSSGQGGYRSRLSGVQVTPDGKSEIANDWELQFKGIEETITSEMRWNGEEDIRRVLSVMFGHVPGSYTVEGNIGQTDVQFKLTDSGRQYLKKRFTQQDYGKKLRRGQYGGTGTNARTPLLSA